MSCVGILSVPIVLNFCLQRCNGCEIRYIFNCAPNDSGPNDDILYLLLDSSQLPVPFMELSSFVSVAHAFSTDDRSISLLTRTLYCKLRLSVCDTGTETLNRPVIDAMCLFIDS